MERKTKVAIWIEALLVALLVFSGVLLSYFSSVASLNTVLENSGSYSQIAVVAQTKLKDLVPTDVKTDPIAYGVINWAIPRFVNEALIQKLSEPTLNALVRLAKTPTTIQGSVIVLDTTQYKTKLSSDINGLNVPQGLKNAGDSFVNSLPSSLNVVNLNEHPNSILAKVIRLRDRVHTLKDIVLVLSLSVIALAILIAVWSRATLNSDIKALSVTTVAAGGATLLASGILALIANNVPLYSGGAIIDAQINTLMVGLSNYYLGNVAEWGFGILLVGLVVFFFTIDKVQAEIKKLYKKMTDMIGSKKEVKKA